MMQNVTVIYKGKQYAGKYEMKDGVVRVFYGRKVKASEVRTPNPELQARLPLIELVRGL